MFKFILLSILLLFPVALFSQHSIELQVGSLIDERVFSDDEFPRNPTYNTISVGYLYQFNDIFSLGAWVGYMRNVPPPVIGGLKFVFFDKEKLAVALNLGIVPSIGVYIFNFYINGIIGLIEEGYEYDSRFPDLKHFKIIRPYIEIGYSWSL